MKVKILYGVLTGTLLSLGSCNDFLDPQPTDRFTDKITWSTEESANMYVNGFYTYLGAYGLFGADQFNDGQGAGLMTDGLTDMLKYGSNLPGAGNANLYAFTPGNITPSDNKLDVWSTAYTRIRRDNEFLEGLAKMTDFDPEFSKLMEVQTRFLRAYVYQQLMMRHGQAILMKQLTSEKNHPLNSEEECWDYLESELDTCIKYLPVAWPAKDAGRITKGAAYAFKSRVMLFAKRWDKAKVAAEKVIELKNGSGALVYELAPAYKDAFKTYASGNREAILEFSYMLESPVHNFDFYYSPGGDNSGYGASACPTQEMVEEYELAAGGYLDWSKWHGKTTENPPYELLEPRFHASVLYNGSDWKGRKIQAYINGADGYMDYNAQNNPEGKTTTGYFLKKYVDENHRDLMLKKSAQPWIEIRLAEVYLNHAEACAMSGDATGANTSLKKVRDRVNLPSKALAGEELMKALRHERKIELAFEGRYYWDLRRWKLAHTELNGIRCHGLRIKKQSDTKFTYEYVDCDQADRSFPQKLYAFPIPAAEIANNLLISQINPW